MTSEAQAQVKDASSAIASLANCIGNALPANSGASITSFSDHLITDGTATFQQCASGAVTCSHAANSCHYGGSKCTGQSYAVDIASTNGYTMIEQAAKQCDSRAWLNNEGTHLHVSDGAENGCGCDTSGANNL
jgi:hypothetical protein